MVNRILRISFLGLIAVALAPPLRANHNYNSGPDSFFESGFEMFYAGPQWLLNALPGSVSDRVARARAALRVSFDRNGDRNESLYRYSNDVGTLANPFNVALFNDVIVFATRGGPAKTTTPIIQDDNTPYLWTAIPGAAWDVAGNWTPNTGPTSYPNAPGDVAGNVMVITTSTIQNHGGGVTVGGIDHSPFNPGGASGGETWTITASTPISMNSGTGTDATISNSNPGGTFINNLTIDGIGGLNLVSNVTITNLNLHGGLITISTPIVGTGGVAVVGPGTTIFSNSLPGTPNSFTGSTTVNSGTLQAATDHSLGSTSSVTVNAAGTLMFGGTNATFDRINNAAPVNLSGGTINTAGLSEYTAVGSTVLPGMGALTLTSASTIDLSNLASIISFADSHNQTWTGSLRILNWTGTIGTGGGTDQVYFGTDPNGLTLAQLNQISFYSDGGTMLLGTAQILADGEIVPLEPIPEPATWIGAALTLGAIGLTQGKRIAKRVRVVG
jgi:autotransporter-associated beta strand protein